MATESNVGSSMTSLRHREAQWTWKSDSNAASVGETQEWTSYSDVESVIIEEAFQKKDKAIPVELDDWWIDIANSTATRKHDKNKHTPIKRMPIASHQPQRVKQERYSGALSVKPFNEWTYGGYWFIKQWKDKQQSDIDDSEIAEKAADGILIEGNRQQKTIEAKILADHLRQIASKDKLSIYQRALQLYTMETFLYKLVNKTLKENDRTKTDTLGPYCYLVYSSWYMTNDKTSDKVYRGLELDALMIDHYKTAIGQKKCWFGFTSTSKDQKVARKFGNTLIIVDMSFVSGLDLSPHSDFPNEQEVLLPAGTKFQIEKVEYTQEETKHHIHVKLLPQNNLLQHQLSTIHTTTQLSLQSKHLDTTDIEILCNALKVNRTLTTLNLTENQISAEGAKALGDALKVNQTLTTLDLAFNTLSDEGAKALGDALKVNQTLTTLDLKWNNICDEGAKALGDALKVNQTLTTVDLENNGIFGEGAIALADALHVNTTLGTLVLRCNMLLDNEAEAFADALKVNGSIRRLDFSGNRISDKGARALVDALKINRNVVSLNLESSEVYDVGVLDVEGGRGG
ncbi:unnamed protein product [Didymodactylos carnosus]|uniref:NAD(P)(+)--arginine ADP-ribosyltransferase n=1 Tax=Didymodactylos carnosus TaxID=1234261 RepID=A0A8S2R6J8_9BILA|nr:unnamed protein product [Didymodactylos carnosus]CAF4134501.1 unnamed protein product [Didymodactylos carnosus]